jgi:dTDP-4-amino-4,6-dideoxygalactose transaminase
MIPFNKANRWGKEIEYVLEAITRGHISGDGTFTKKCHRLLEEELGVPKVLLTTSCTHALEMAALLLDIQPGDEVLVPSFTFVSTLNAFVLRGATPVFVDVRPDTLNLDEAQLPGKITKRTKAIVPVHYGGIGCEMDAIMAVANEHRISVIEDNAHGLYGRYRGRYLGTFGQMATQSFHETKNFTCGEGGALLINDGRYVERAEVIREKGTNRALFFQGMIDKYGWIDIGSSYLPSDMLSAFLFAQLEARERVQAKRRHIWTYYRSTLLEWATANGVTLPTVPAHCEPSYHLFHLLLPSWERRQELIAHLKERAVHAVFHYLPLHLSKMGLALGGKPGDCPVTEDVSGRLLRLPFFGDLTDEDLAHIVAAVRSFKC